MKTIIKALFFLVTLTLAVPVFAQSDFDATKARAEAQYEIGLMYASGRGVAQSDQVAVKWSILAAEQSNVYAQFILGFMYAGVMLG